MLRRCWRDSDGVKDLCGGVPMPCLRERGRTPPAVNRSKPGVMRSGKWAAGLLVALVVFGWNPETSAQEVPSSRRSRQVKHRLRPVLEKAMAKKKMIWGSRIYLRIFKAEKQLEVWIKRAGRFHLFKSYPICTYGRSGLGPKIREGDGRAPEGFYFVTPRQMNPHSSYHLAFNLGYPNRYDQSHGRTGSALMVHGSCVSVGCFAMTDRTMEEIYALADAALSRGQPYFRVHIFPFRMTDRNLRQHRHSPWFDFWLNLKRGHDWFSRYKSRPPDVTVRHGRYVFESAAR